MSENESKPENEQEDGDKQDFWSITRGHFARLYTSYAVNPIRCRVIDTVEDPSGRPMLLVMLPGKVKHLIYFESILSYEIFDSLDQLKKMVEVNEDEEFNQMGTRQGKKSMLFGPSEIEQP